MNAVNIERGEAVRRALLAVARVAHAQSVPLPTAETISSRIGICEEQCRRHFRRLIDDGVVVTRRVGTRRHIEEIRP